MIDGMTGRTERTKECEKRTGGEERAHPPLTHGTLGASCEWSVLGCHCDYHPLIVTENTALSGAQPSGTDGMVKL